MAGARDLFGLVLRWLASKTPVTPAERTFYVLVEDRTFDVPAESRTFDVAAEDRVFVVEAG